MLKLEVLKPMSDLSDAEKNILRQVNALFNEIEQLSTDTTDDWIVSLEKKMFL